MSANFWKPVPGHAARLRLHAEPLGALGGLVRGGRRRAQVRARLRSQGGSGRRAASVALVAGCGGRMRAVGGLDPPERTRVAASIAALKKTAATAIRRSVLRLEKRSRFNSQEEHVPKSL